MQFYHLKVYQWLLNSPYRALEKAYQTSKRVRNIQKDYLYYKNSIGTSSRHSWYNVGIYLDNVLNQSASEIYWNLLEFKVTTYLCHFLHLGWPRNIINSFLLKTNNNKQNSYNFQKNVSVYNPDNTTEDSKNFINRSDKDLSSNFWNNLKLESKNRDNWYIDNISSEIDLNERRNFLPLNTTDEETEHVKRKLAWIEAVLADLDLLKNESWSFYTVMSQSTTKALLFPYSLPSFFSKPKQIPYESLGLVPRSITRTLSRFRTELEGRSVSLVLPEFRLAKYQAVASLQYMMFLILCPWLVSFICEVLFLEPWIENWWNTSQSQVFLSFAQEEKALRRLQEVEELLWLDIIMADSSTRQPQDLSAQIHQKTIDLVERYNQESINTVLHLFTNFISLLVIIALLIWGKKRLAILNSWIQEVFYSLSDTMKAFFILLFTDLCIGFHSPHGWEILIEFLLEHLGFSHNKQVISCFVSTFPVILDTVFKYWIFRHLNRISPSIVVSYHTMNE
jgi:CemA family